MENCVDKGPTDIQSPITIPPVGGFPLLWPDVSFLPAWQEAKITSDKHGFSDWVYRIDATDGNLGIFYAVDALGSKT
jgi:hypothetical protein